MLTLTLLLTLLSPVQTAQSLPYESTKSPALTLPAALYWDVQAPTLQAAQFYQWAIYVNGVRELLPEATCGAPQGQTPATAWTCTAPIKPAWLGAQLEVVYYLNLPSLASANLRGGQ